LNFHSLSTLNAILNGISFLFLMAGLYHILHGNKEMHKKMMLGAVTMSILFFISYLIYHIRVGSVPYPYHDWTRPLYFLILVPHVIFAALMVPFIVALLFFAFKDRFEQHKKLAHWVFPVWSYVSFTGVVIYYMLYIM